MLNLKNTTERKQQDKIITIVLSILLIFVVIICFVFICKSNNTEGRDIVLVKDMFSDNKRIISDKTDISKVSGGQVTLKIEEPEGILNPDDVITEGAKKEPEDVVLPIMPSEGTLPDIVEEPYVVNPLKRYEDEEVVQVVRQEISPYISPEERREQILREQEERLKIVRERNQGRGFFSYALMALSGGNVLDSDLSKLCEKGCVIIPFSIYSKDSLKRVKEIESIYEEYKDKVTFVFLNTSYEASERMPEIKTKLESEGITTEIPIYYDMGPNIINNEEIYNINYIILNSDIYVYKKSAIGEDISSLRSKLDDLIVEVELFAEQDSKE